MKINENLNDFLLIIDGNSLLATSYYGILPPSLKNKKLTPQEEEQFYPELLHTSDGKYTNGIYGFMKTLMSILVNQRPKYIVVNWDAGRNTFRRQLYPEYKGTRGTTPRPLKEQQEMMRNVLKFIGIKQFISDNFEADDFSGSLAKYFSNETYVRILTKDRDHLQLIDDKVNVWLTFPMDKSGQSKSVDTLNAKFGVDASKLNVPTNVFRVTKELVKDYYGAEADRIIDLKALMGDTADNIPGVKGIGEKTAILLVENFKNIETLYQYLSTNTEDTILQEFKNIGIRGGKKVLTSLLATSTTEIVGENAAILSKQLATIKTNINFGNINLDIFQNNIDENNLIATLKRLEFNQILNQYYVI